MAAQTGQENYFQELESQKKRLGDYEQVHFRKSFIAATKVQTDIVLSPKRPAKPQLVPFNKNTAALYLRQTENLWLVPNMTRHEASKLLFNRPTGSFYVRNSQKARYALTMRMTTNDPAVSHYLIQTNQQGFLTIQGSNLPFLSIYDLLAYFCFNQSGGMPCLLHAPDRRQAATIAEFSESSESEGEDAVQADGDYEFSYNIQGPSVVPRPSSQAKSPDPPPLPPRPSSKQDITLVFDAEQGTQLLQHHRAPVVDMFPTHEEVYIDKQKQVNYMKNHMDRQEESEAQKAVGRSPRLKRKPPPKPPRNFPVEGEEGEDLTAGQREEIHNVVRRVDSIVDMDSKRLFHQMARNSPSHKPKPQPKPRTAVAEKKRRLSRSSEHISELSSPAVQLQPPPKPEPSSQKGSPSHVASLIQRFESESPPRQVSPPSPRKKLPLNRTRSSEVVIVPNFQQPPLPPPKPRAPPRPPKPLPMSTPVIPPRTPLPLLPPKPLGSKPPLLLPRHRDRSSSDVTKPRMMRSVDLPIVPPRRHNKDAPPLPDGGGGGGDPGGGSHGEDSEEELIRREQEEMGEDGWVGVGMEDLSEDFASTSIDQLPGNSSKQDAGAGNKSSGLKWRPGWTKKLKFHPKKPRKKIKKYIVDLAGDQSTDFGRKINDFISEMRGQSTEPHQKMLSEVRNFITSMHDFLLQHHRSGLANCGMDACDNLEHVIETSLQQCILQPLSHYIYLRIEEYFSRNGYLFQLQRSVHQGKTKSPEEMGIRKHLMVPGEKAMADISEIFQRMMKTYCAISKLEYLLEAVRLTYENVRDSKHPKKAMNDLGADDFLPLFVWVLVQCGFHRAEIEAEYMWGLAHPSLFNGEAGYYLTTLTSAVNVLKELTQPPTQPLPPVQQLPAMNYLQTELKVLFEDENTGQYSSAFYLPILPTMAAADICEIIAERHRIPNPQDYALFTVINGQAKQLEDHQRPQEIKLQWTLENTIQQAAGQQQQQPGSRFIAYKRRGSSTR